ncbi:replication protein C-like [Hoeflea marina]|uniref:Replication protein C-like n=1 Tax=Hoeflea marina TaxID=274592 RepID=A0A317PQR3_9HYPH|nr:replication initiation protein RepC [Hoeflea marina]PWW03802.1 replication protein C-like [Hoeflea marina]
MSATTHNIGLRRVTRQPQKLPSGKRPPLVSAHEPVISPEGVDRWKLLDLLTDNRRAFGLSASEIAVVKGFFKCFPKGRLPVGKPHRIEASNRKLQGNADHMPSSTFNRVLRLLEKKDYISRGHFGNGKRKPAFGSDAFAGDASAIDIRPLIDQAEMIAHQAGIRCVEEIRQEELRTRIKAIRPEIRDLIACTSLPPTSAVIDVLDRYTGDYRLPRRASSCELQKMLDQHCDDRDALMLNTGSSGAHFGHPIHKSNTEVKNIESYLSADGFRRRGEEPESGTASLANGPSVDVQQIGRLCPELVDYLQGQQLSAPGMFAAADLVRTFFLVGDKLWESAVSASTQVASILAVAIVLRDQANIRNHGAYLGTMLRNLVNGSQDEARLLRTLQSKQSQSHEDSYPVEAKGSSSKPYKT